MNAEDSIFGTPLVAAARGGHTEVVAALLRKEEVLLDQHSQRDTPLTAAVNGGHLECARMLLERGSAAGKALARIPQLPDDGKCAHGHRMPSDDPLTLACKRGDVDLVRLLLRHGADAAGGGEGTCDTPLTAAAANGHAHCLREVMAAGADVDAVARWAGRTALVAAAESDSSLNLECCEILLEGGADPNFVSSGVVGRRLGYGAVHAAAARMDAAMVELLISRGADPNRRAKNTDTKEVKSRRAAAAQALWGPDVAGQRLDNTRSRLNSPWGRREGWRRMPKNAPRGGATRTATTTKPPRTTRLSTKTNDSTLPRSVGVDGTCTRGRWTRASRAPGRWPR